MYIKTKRLVLTKFEINDINEEYLAWLNDPVHMKFSEQKNILHDYFTSLSYLKSFDFSSSYFLKINFENKKIGTVTVFIEKKNKITVANIGLLMGPLYSGFGFGLETLNAVKQYFGELHKPITVLVGTRKNNQAMNRVAIKSGMKLLTLQLVDSFLLTSLFLDFVNFNYYYQKF